MWNLTKDFLVGFVPNGSSAFLEIFRYASHRIASHLMFLYCSFLAHNLSPSHLIGAGAVCGFVERGGLWIAALETKPSIEFLLVPNSNTILYSKCNTATVNPCTEAAYKEQKKDLFIALRMK